MSLGNGYNDGHDLLNAGENYTFRVKSATQIPLNHLGGNIAIFNVHSLNLLRWKQNQSLSK